MLVKLVILAVMALVVGSVLHLLSRWWCAAYREDPPVFRARNFRLDWPESRRIWLGIILLYFGTLAIFLYQFGTSPLFWSAAVFAAFLLLMSVIDLEHYILPDFLTKPLIVLGVGQAWLGYHCDIKTSLVGIVAGYGSLWLINTLFRIVRKKEGMGYGDFKLFAAIGAWTGWQLLPLVVFLASISGILFAVFSRGFTQDLSKPYPFGPMLALGGVIALSFGHAMMRWYLELFM